MNIVIIGATSGIGGKSGIYRPCFTNEYMK